MENLRDFYFKKRDFYLGILLVFLISFFGISAYCLAKSEAQIAYEKAEKELRRFARSRRIKYRRYWLRIIYRFRHIYLCYPGSTVAPKALYRTARLYEELYGYSGRKADLVEALKYYRLLWKKYPQSSLRDDAIRRAIIIYEKKLKNPAKALELKRYIRHISPKNTYKIAKKAKKDKDTSRTKSHTKKSKKDVLRVFKDVRHWSSSDYSRVVIDFSGRVHYHPHLLKAFGGRPPRLYVDCSPAKLSPYLKHVIPIKDGLLKQVRLGQYKVDTVRVVLDLESLTQYRVFFLDEPPRLVIDLIGQAKEYLSPLSRSKQGSLSLVQQLGLCIRKIVIDPGHGGKDPGARSRRGLREKDIVLKVSKLLAQKLHKRLGCEVILTRSRDVFIPLEQRTAIANMKRADLFISIHVNSSPNRRAKGIETYYLNFASDKEAMRVAAMENAASTRSLSELQDLLKNILLYSKVEESSRLAKYVQDEMIHTLRRRYRRIKNRGIKTAPFVVLIGTRMPAVLVEIGFISNKYEEKLLRDSRYLDTVAEGLARGIEHYMRDTKLFATR